MGLTTTKELRWDAGGAPTLNANAGSFRNLARDFLEDCGWSVIWQDAGAQKVVLRNSMGHGGSGCYIRILDDGSFSSSTRVARIDIYETMSDIDTGTASPRTAYFWKDRTGSGGPNAFVLTADERTFYATAYTNGIAPAESGFGYYKAGLIAGDYDPIIPGDPGIIIGGADSDVVGTGASASMPNSMFLCTPANLNPNNTVWNGLTLSRTPTLAIAQVRAAIVTTSAENTNGIGGSSTPMANPTPGTSDVHFSPAFVGAGGMFRGRLRGLYIPLNRWDGGGANVGTTHSPGNMSGVTSLGCLAGSSSSAGNAVAVGRLFFARNVSWDDV